MYQPRETCIHLAHEVAHFVGTGIRHRSLRHKLFIEIMSELIAGQCCTDLCNGLAERGRIQLAKLFRRFIRYTQKELCNDMSELLKDVVSTLSKEDQIENIWENEHIRSNIFISYVSTALQRVLHHPVYQNEQFQKGKRSERSLAAYRIRHLSVDFRIYAREHWGGDLDELEASLIDYVQLNEEVSSPKYSAIFAQILQLVAPTYTLETLMLLMKETQADVTSILTLRITPLQYFQSFFQSGLTYADRELGMFLQFRMFFVLCALQEASTKRDIPFLTEIGWNRPFFISEKDRELLTPGMADTLQKIEKTMRDLTKKIVPSICSDYTIFPITSTALDVPVLKATMQGYHIFYNKYVVQKYLCYLRNCIDSFVPELQDRDTGDERRTKPKDIAKIYATICNADILEQVEVIDQMLYTYEEKRNHNDQEQT